jgi:hypothetical protein
MFDRLVVIKKNHRLLFKKNVAVFHTATFFLFYNLKATDESLLGKTNLFIKKCFQDMFGTYLTLKKRFT